MNALQAEPISRRKSIARRGYKQEKKEDVEIPDFMMHRMKNAQEQSVSLPRLADKIVFFPEEYASVPVRASQKKEIDRLQNIIKPKDSEPHFSSTIDLNP
jgi:hypothetical protein